MFFVIITRILKDHSDSSGIQNQVLDDLRARKEEAKQALKREQEVHQQSRVGRTVTLDYYSFYHLFSI